MLVLNAGAGSMSHQLSSSAKAYKFGCKVTPIALYLTFGLWVGFMLPFAPLYLVVVCTVTG